MSDTSAELLTSEPVGAVTASAKVLNQVEGRMVYERQTFGAVFFAALAAVNFSTAFQAFKTIDTIPSSPYFDPNMAIVGMLSVGVIGAAGVFKCAWDGLHGR